MNTSGTSSAESADALSGQSTTSLVVLPQRGRPLFERSMISSSICMVVAAGGRGGPLGVVARPEARAPPLAELCDRVILMRHGHVVRDANDDEMTEAGLLRALNSLPIGG